MTTGLLLVAHGSKRDGSSAVAEAIGAEAAGLLADVPVQTTFLDHSTKTPSWGLEQLARAGCGDAVVVPLLLGAAFHLREDLPNQLGTRIPTRLADHLGPDPLVIDALVDRLGSTDAETVVLVAAGTTEASSQHETAAAANLLAKRLDREVTIAFAAAAQPDVPTAISQAKGTVVVLPYLLCEGRFSDQTALQAEAAGVECRPVIGAHPAIAELVVTRYTEIISR